MMDKYVFSTKGIKLYPYEITVNYVLEAFRHSRVWIALLNIPNNRLISDQQVVDSSS